MSNPSPLEKRSEQRPHFGAHGPLDKSSYGEGQHSHVNSKS